MVYVRLLTHPSAYCSRHVSKYQEHGVLRLIPYSHSGTILTPS
nr:MAG TPA: hypothetical protein [Caudoviricetes sp.]